MTQPISYNSPTNTYIYNILHQKDTHHMSIRKNVVTALTKLVEQSEGNKLSDVSRAISALRYPEFCQPILKLYQQDPEKYDSLVFTYCCCASNAQKNQILQFLNSENPGHVDFALMALIKLYIPEAEPRLHELLKHPDSDTRKTAQRCLKNLKKHKPQPHK